MFAFVTSIKMKLLKKAPTSGTMTSSSVLLAYMKKGPLLIKAILQAKMLQWNYMFNYEESKAVTVTIKIVISISAILTTLIASWIKKENRLEAQKGLMKV